MPAQDRPDEFSINVTPKNSAPQSRSVYQRRKTPWWQTPGAIIGGMFLVIAIAAGFLLTRGDDPTPAIRIQSSDPITLNEEDDWSYRPPIKLNGVTATSLRYELTEAPEGVAIGEDGVLTWKPSEQQGPGTYQVAFQVKSGNNVAKSSVDVTVEEWDQPPVFEAITPPKGQPGETVSVTVTATDPDVPTRTVEYAVEVPAELQATVKPTGGSWTWNIPADQPPGSFPFLVTAKEVGGTLTSTQTVTIVIDGPSTSEQPLTIALRKQGATVREVSASQSFPDMAGDLVTLDLNGDTIHAFHYESAILLNRDADSLAKFGSDLLGKELGGRSDLQVFRSDDDLAVYAGTSQTTMKALKAHFGDPVLKGPLKEMPTVTQTPRETEPETKTDRDVELIRTLFKRDRLVTADAYPKLRKLFADRFAKAHADSMQTAWGDDYEAMMTWLDERPEIREELFTAVDPKFDQMVAVFQMFRTLKDTFPEDFEDYYQLAIATSVVWDAPRRAVTNYEHHARRTHSKMSEELLTATDVFRYFVESESIMQGRAKFLPWEFLIWMVNDRTPLKERRWAVQNYLQRRAQIGTCYKDVPYDTEMLRTSSQVCKLDGKDYVLPNIRQFGGVCAMQADFASRVAKSLGVPAAYVGGESRGGELHAWVMWVELLAVNRNQIRFSLESYGRYQGDKYYVGKLDHPQTGKETTDRVMERKLQVVGSNPKAKRHADLAIKALELLEQEEPLNIKEDMTTLLTVLNLCPGHEPTWRRLAKLAGSDEIDRDERRMMVKALDSLFKTFRVFPDFTWKVFGDLTRFEEDPRKKIQLYERLLAVYQQAGRPDLACEAALTTAKLLVDNEQPGDAVQKLAAVSLRFADEGRYVPQMLDRMEAIYNDQGGDPTKLVSFYQQLVVKIPPKRGNEPSPYAIKMYRRSIDVFQKNNRPDLAQTMSAKLATLQAGQ